jgi:hypothetical protein
VAVGRAGPIVGLVEEIPGVDAGIVLEAGDHADDLGLQLIVALGIAQQVFSGALHSAGIMDVRLGVALFAEFRKWIPAAIERDEHDPDLVLGGDAEELVRALEKSFFVMLP